jgi:hypothetical protein
MTNKGFIPSSATFIRQIRQNLTEGRYSIGDTGFSIFKELVQNADDAVAKVMHIGMCEALPGAEHPLFKSPGMFVINDGKFERHDAANIRRFGENTKAIDAAKIGKFGLGLKSIFHLCEAFFFLGPAKPDDDSQYVSDVLNPWSGDQGDSFHAEWDSFSKKDEQLVLRALRPLFDDKACFCLWIPLRQKRLLAGNEPIQHFYPGDDRPDWLTSGDLPSSVAALLPFLSNLECVSGWSGIGRNSTRVFTVALRQPSQRRRLFEELSHGQAHQFGGEVSVTIPNRNDSRVRFVGLEINPSDPELAVLEKDEHWPSDLGRDPETGRAKNIREKALQHAGVCLTARRLPSGKDGRLSISWAVFLPLGEPEIHALPGSNIDMSLSLHGYFFADAGRNRPVGLRDRINPSGALTNDEHLRCVWNRRLAEVGTVPQVPASLNRLIAGSDGQLRNTDIVAITRAIEGSRFHMEFQNDICREHCWAHLYLSDGRQTWRLFSGEEKLAELPLCPDGTLPWQVFPALIKLVAGLNVTNRLSPRLVRDETVVLWPAQHVRQLLDSVPPRETLLQAQWSNYLVDFLELLSEQQRLDIHAGTVARITRRGLSECGIEWPPERSAHVRRLLARIPAKHRLPLSFNGEIGALLFKVISLHDLDIVFVPKDLDSVDAPGSARLEPEHAIEIMKSLAARQQQVQDPSHREAISVLSAQLLQHVLDQSQVLKGIANLRLFNAKSCRERTDRLATWVELENHRSNKTLFVSPSPRAYSLQKALSDDRVLLISRDCFESLFPDDSPSQCTPLQILETLARPIAPKLAAPETRVDILKDLRDFKSESRQASTHCLCVRYLLHGEPAQFESTAPLLASQSGPSEVWRRITLISLRTQNAQWRLLDVAFARILTDEHKESFNIQDIGPESAIPLVLEAGPTAFGDLEPSPGEYSILLDNIDDDGLCREMPIHEDLSGRYLAIGDRCYWESEIPFPADLNQSVTILRKSGNEGSWRRQLELARQLDATAVIEIVLDQNEPGKYWAIIMSSLAQAHDLSDSDRKRLRSLAWLPSHGGNYIRPEDIIDLPDIAPEVTRLTATMPGIFFDPGLLESELRDHPSYELLRRQAFPGTETAMSMLGELLIQDSANHIGPVRRDRFNQWRDVAGDMPAEILPCGTLVHRAAEYYSTATIQIFDQLTKPFITSERIQFFLDFLRRTHQRENNRRRKTSVIAVFNEYLEVLVAREGNMERFADQDLPTRAGNWRSAGDLCFDIEGVTDDHLIDEDTATALRCSPLLPEEKSQSEVVKFVKSPALRDINALFDGFFTGHTDPVASLGQWRKHWESAADLLASFFQSWKGLVSDEEIGGFLSVLGDDPRVCELAQTYLGRNRTLQQTRANLGLDIDLIDKRVVIGVSQGKHIRVRNLFGEMTKVPKTDHAATLFVGFGSKRNPFPRITVLGKEAICLCLTDIALEQDGAELSRLLRDSTVRVLSQAYGSLRSAESVSLFWEDLAQSDQLDIKIAQERVVESGFLILDQLGLRSVPQIDVVLDKWDAAQRLSIEQQSRSTPRLATRNRNPAEEMREAKAHLRGLLEDNTEVHVRIVEAIRERVAEYYQYTKAAVPFEIFQNADDASVELFEHFNLAADQRQLAEIFHVVSTPSLLTFSHFGRRINQYPLETPDATMGFDNDLWKMLVLSLSNKSHHRETDVPEVTGKFGLGFKSCYLISDRPRLLSGRLAFEVTGAMYPRRLIGGDRASLDECWCTLLENSQHVTILQLPLTDATVDEVLVDFRRLSHLVVVFAHRIRHCIFDGGEAEVKWQPVPVPKIPRCDTGAIVPLPSTIERARGATRALLFKSDYGSVLFAINASCFDAFPDDVPTIWVTAPTLELLNVGFLINGPFALDVGRAQLAREFSHNRDLALLLGVAIGTQLCELFRATTLPEGWGNIRDALQMTKDANKYDFWDSLFGLLGNAVSKRANSDGSGDALVRQILWEDRDSGAASLYRTCEALPTRLRGAYQRLVSLPRIKHGLTGLLEEDPEVFAAMSRWSTFQEHAPPGTVVSSEYVHEPLKQLAEYLVSHVRPLSISTVLGWEFKHGNYADSETAARLGTAITKRTFDLIRDRVERSELRALLDTVEFKGKDNRYHPAKELLLGHVSDLERDDRREDERFRTQFAPDNRVLNEDYQGEAAAFFDVCRDALDAPVRLMADWVVEAADLQRQIGALDYLAHGQLAVGLITELKRRGLDGTWLAQLVGSDAFRSLNEATRARLLDLLPDDARPSINWYGLLGDRRGTGPADTEQALLAIHEWWSNNRNRPQPEFAGRTYVQEYEYRTYPGGEVPRHLAADDFETETAGRKDWMTLFILGLVHTMGGFQREQHRGFLSFCERNGALKVFSARDADAEEWIALLENYFEAQTDSSPFLHWMRQFVGIFAISRRLDDYTESFLSIQRHKTPFPLTVITEPATDNRAPVSAPSISRVLGMGACFVVRELFRLGILTNNNALQHAFVPVKGVRVVFEQLGWDRLHQPSRKWEASARLYAFVVEHIGTDKATFCNDFDIPFQFISEDQRLQMKLLHGQIHPPSDDEDDLLDSF